MRRIALLIIVCLVMSVGCSSPAVMDIPAPTEPETVIPTEEPAVVEPVGDEPVIEEPTIEEPAVEEPVIEEPTIEEPVVTPPVEEDVVVEPTPPVVEEPVDDSPRTTFPEFGSSKVFRFYEPNPGYLPGSYATEDEDAQAMFRLKEQFTYEDGRGLGLPNPTYAEVLAFIAEDKTDEWNYTTHPDYNGHNGCTVRSITLRDAANRVGIRCACLIIMREPQGHALSAFETTDRGIVWFDLDTERTPCFDKDDLFPLPWLGGGEMPPTIRPLDKVVYIW